MIMMNNETKIRVLSEQLIEYASGTPEIEDYTDLQILLCLVGEALELDCYMPVNVEKILHKWCVKPEFDAAIALTIQRVADAIISLSTTSRPDGVLVHNTGVAREMLTEAVRFEKAIEWLEEQVGDQTDPITPCLSHIVTVLEAMITPNARCEARESGGARCR
jgi:hypothetical protein